MKKIVISRLMLVAVIVWITSGYAFGQERLITGTVYDAALSEPLPGATVIIKGSTTGATTDLDGKFQINASDGQVLVVSYIGYLPEEITIAGESNIEVSLAPELTELSEVIVIGYGTQKKIDKTGAVSQVTTEEMKGGVITDPIQTIQGRSAGVVVTKKGGDPNSGYNVKIRGASGFDSSTEPLYVVDGVPGVDATTIAPEDIETFNILKDAASTAIYGSRGANGVIIITTKKGKEGRAQVHLNTNHSLAKVAKKVDLLSASDLREYSDANNLNMVDGGADTDWQDEIYRTGFSQSYNLGVSGGTEKGTYYASLSHSDWEGVMKGTDKQRTIAKVNLTHKAFNDKLTLSGSLSNTIEKNDYENYDGYDKDDIIYQALSRNPTDPIYNEDGTYYVTSREFNYENPIATINEIDNIRDAKRFFGNFKADWELFEGFIGTLNIGYTRDDHESSYFRPANLYATADNGWASKQYENTNTKLLEGYFNYSKNLNGVHNLNVTGGYSWQESVYNGFKAEGAGPQSDYLKYNKLSGLTDINSESIDSWKGMWRLIGFFGRVQYNYNSKYYVSGSARYDGSTKFGSDNRWGFFPTAAVGWNIDQEDFMGSLTWLSKLKLRGSWGVSGNQEIGEYRSQLLFEKGEQLIDPVYGKVKTWPQAWNENPDLKWEETTEINFGIDFAFLSNKISGSFDVYQKTTDDLLGEYTVPVPPYPTNRIFANSGTVENKGIELNIQWFAVNRSNFDYKTILNFSTNKQEMTDLGEYAPEDGVRKEGYLTGRGLIGDNNYVSGVIVGEELGSFYLPVYAGMSSDGAFLFESTSGGVTRELSQAQRKVVGSPLPSAEFGWVNNFTFYKNWNLDFSFRAMVGNDVYNATKMFFDYNGNIPNLNGSPEAVEWAEQGRTSGPTVADIYVEDGSFVRLDYITLGYTFDTKNLDWISSLKLSIAANNLFTLTNYSGVDPETSYEGVSFGIDQYNVYPKTRTLSFGINATF